MTGQGTPDRVYGHFLCRGDQTQALCRDCVAYASRDILQKCPEEKVSTVWYDQCMLTYSNQPILSTIRYEPVVEMVNVANISDPTRFNSLLDERLNSLIPKAARGQFPGKKFAVDKVNFTVLQALYKLVQCTPDLTTLDCTMCLQTAFQGFPRGRQGSRYFNPSCVIRYETYVLYDETAVALLSPPAPSPANREVPPPTPSLVPRPKVGNDITNVESLQFDFATVQAATEDFSANNKLGEGGFGKVYKGVLPTGQPIAVKRLSVSSEQGAEEFKNEVMVVAKLQHKNLVRQLGFCMEGEEKILVIIHRDLKTSNVLLDMAMNPKVADFGMAKIFGVDQTHGTTNKVVGTYGYMSPEYAMHGKFSVKSDVYSFGVMVLEIISGERNSSFYESGTAEDLPSHAWKHWRDGTPLEVLDPILKDSCSRNEVIRCIQMSLLCLQEDPASRPSMATLALMLNSCSVTLPVPEKPAFFPRSRTGQQNLEFGKLIAVSVNEVSITDIEPR
ncbi:hypothetical protein CDL15_Pgr012996 [Punica granatum]|uniref:Cysteine-rich receptor-like protein kinase 10 n=2 Tax=Punica granatum TaxID=22663 RepID=A0A218XE80_PUNGR|nr:hypothetical protein CDL15_Pgr012996 [Punica granatum]